jgi:copper/silver efflux system protein
MIEKIIALSVKNRFLILLILLFLAGASYWSLQRTPLDAIPDLSPPQVIVQINWAGQSPKVVQEQGIYPLVSQFLAIPDIKTVRGYSSYEHGLIYIIFKQGTDLYWARSRVLEQLASIQSKLPVSMHVSLGPDATGVGWIYEYALVSKTKNLAQLRTLQDYFYKYALLGVNGVSSVASVGGFIPSFEVTVNDHKLIRYNLGIGAVKKALAKNNNDTGGGILIKNGYEWMLQADGYVKDLNGIRNLVVAVQNGIPVTIGDLGDVHKVPASRRGLVDLNGNGETVGGIVMVQYKGDVYKTIQRVKAKLKTLHVPGVKVVPVYDRSMLIQKAVGNLKHTLIEESLIVIAVITFFLLHLRSSVIVLLILPLTVGVTFILMHLFGISSNIMSLGGIAIAIGAMVDATIVMIENTHKMLLKRRHELQRELTSKERLNTVISASQLVGRPIFFALALVIVSFLPIFALRGQEGLLFTPLAFTKTFAIAAGALLSITVVPVLMFYFIRGKILEEKKNPISRFFLFFYRPVLLSALKLRYIVLALTLIALGGLYPLYKSFAWEFMPPLNEHTAMYMPVTPYGISIDEAKQLVQKTDKIIKSFPEVKTVFGKAGRADTPTDPAPLSMLETIITFKPQSEWPKKMTYSKLMDAMQNALQVPGLVNSWTYPIQGRIDMLLSGIRTPLGIKLFGPNLHTLQVYSEKIATLLGKSKLTLSAFADQPSTGYYMYMDIKTKALQRYGLDKNTLFDYVTYGLGGVKISTLYDGLARFPITLRFKQNQRLTLQEIRNLQIKTKLGFVALKTFAHIYYKQGPSVIKSEMASPVNYIYITPKEGVSGTQYKQALNKTLAKIKLPSDYYYQWAGKSEYLAKAMRTIVWILPSALLLILLLVYFALKRIIPTLIVFFTLPFALLGGLVYLYFLHFNMSIAIIVGFLALLGVASETAIVMIIYLQEAVDEAKAKYQENFTSKELREAVYAGAALRLRPKLMTVFAILASLLPIMYRHGVGSEVMQRIAAPMIGGILSSAVLSLLIIPILFNFYAKKELKKSQLS